MSLFGLRGLTWDMIDQKYWVITVDKFGRASAHADVPRFSSRAGIWQSSTRSELGLVGTHHDTSPVSQYEIRPGLTAPPGFPQVIVPDRDGQTFTLPTLEAPKPAPKEAAVAQPGTIQATHMMAVFAKRNDNTDPTIPHDKAVNTITTEEPAKMAAVDDKNVVDAEKARQKELIKKNIQENLDRLAEVSEAKPATRKTRKPADTPAPFMSSPVTVYTCLSHILRALDQMRAETPDWSAVDQSVESAKDILGDKWIKED